MSTMSKPTESHEIAPGQQPHDDSNPQQGNASPRPASEAAPVPKNPVRGHKADGYSRPSLMIPPNKKDERKLFVGGLPANVTNEEFRTFFEGFGTVLESIVLADKVTGRSRGFGFVTFADEQTSRAVLTSGTPDGTGRSTRLEMMGKVIEVKSAQPKESKNQRSRRREDAIQHQGYPTQPHYVMPPADPYVQQPVYAGYNMAPFYYPEEYPMMQGYAFYAPPPPPRQGFVAVPPQYPPLNSQNGT